jgi:transposase
VSELGTLNRREISALAGSAPVNHDLGRFQGKRAIFGVKAGLRTGIHLATLLTTKHNLVIKQFDARVVASCRPKKTGLGGIYAEAADHPQCQDP